MVSVRELLESYAEVGRSLGSSECVEVSKLCEVMKFYLRERGLKALGDCAHRALLVQYSADSTPVKTRMYNTVGSGSHRTKSAVNVKQDYWVQSAFFTWSRGGGQYGQHAIFKDPLPLTHGKSNRAVLACAKSFLEGSCFAGSEQGVTICAQVHDRGLGAQFRHAVAGCFRDALDESEMAGLSEEHSPFHFFLEVGCCLHDLHNSLRWSCLLSSSFPRNAAADAESVLHAVFDLLLFV
eukprot:6491986-Amphidinium_carterae.1